jgi:hypothetical protein
MTNTRAGSALLLCLALSAFAVMVGYAFLRAAARQEMSGKSEVLIGLARDAARSGAAHAIQQILIDYNAPSLDLATGAGTVTLTPAPTFLDGPFTRPFVSSVSPYRLNSWGVSQSADDVDTENCLLYTLFRKEDEMGGYWHDSVTGNQSGCMIYDARGRWVEVNYHNSARPSPSDPNPIPVAATNFSDPNAPKPTLAAGLFMDDNLHRLTGGTVEDQRRKARYRVRYAVGVEDLSSHLLINPRASMNVDWKDPNNDYRVIPQWLDRSAYVLDNMTSCWASNRATSLRMGHIFRGRGNATNADRAWAPGLRNGLPATFPMMFRTNQDEWRLPRWYGTHALTNSTRYPPYPATPSSPYTYTGMGGRLFSFPGNASFEPITANPAGGEILTPTGQFSSKPYAHDLVGPLYSWYNQLFALQGSRIPAGQNDTYWDGYNGGEQSWITRPSFFNTLHTLFGRRLEASTAPPTDWKWYQGRLDTPWQINLLTAPPQMISEMLLAYIPPHLKTLHYTHDAYYKKIGQTSPAPPGTPQDIFSPTETVAKRNYNPANGNNGWDYYIPGLDILNDQISSGFAEFPAPSDKDTLLKPDYYWAQLPPPAVQHPPTPISEFYPGPLGRGDSTKVDEGSDDLGELIDADSAYGEGLNIGRCTHTNNPLLFFGGSDLVSYWDETPTTRWMVIRRIDTLTTTYRYSYFWDLLYAMTTTLSYARATWVQYPNTVFDPRATSGTLRGFDTPSLRDPLAYDTIEEIDALFLRQLGESYTAPGTPCSDRPIVSKGISAWPPTDRIRFSLCTKPVSNTIRSLVTGDLIKTASGVASSERGKVMERVLNDFRMSFFGSSPKYADFRPMDFDGDGHVTCSCYDINPAATPNEIKYKTSRWKASVGSGRGPAPTPFTTFDPKVGPNPWFTVTGCFCIAKIHFYRIFTRGEVYDNLLKKPVAQQDLETVLAVDPEAPQFPPAGRVSTEQRILFEQWRYNDSVSEIPLQAR